MEKSRGSTCDELEELPGFRFHPTEEELLEFYLKGVLYGKRFGFDIIGTVNIYSHDPWDLPGLAKIGEREWYFFVPRDRKHPNGGRPNRTTENGFWKATGSDRPIRSGKDPKKVIGLKKTLVFYRGRAPRGIKTNWIMNEYRMPDSSSHPPKEDIVLCKIYMKATSMKTLEQRAAMEEDQTRVSTKSSNTSTPSRTETVSSSEVANLFRYPNNNNLPCPKAEELSKDSSKLEIAERDGEVSSSSSQQGAVVAGCWTRENLPELHVPKHGSFDWMQDPFMLRSPWFENWTPYANVLNF